MMAPVQRPALALLLRLGAALALSTLFMLVKVTAERGVAFAEILFWRSFLTVPMIGVWLGLRGELGRLKSRRMPAHARRAAMGTAGMMMTFGAPVLLPLAESTTLGFTTPIIAVILSALILHERVGPWRWSAVSVGLIGVIVMAQPGNQPLSSLGVALALGGAFMTALISIQIRDLSRTDEPLAIVFWFGTFASIFYGLGLPFFYSAHHGEVWLLLLTIGVLGCLAQLLLTAALRFGQVSSVIVMDYSALVWATLYGWLVWNHLPAATFWIGAPLVITAGLAIAWREHRIGKQPTVANAAEAP